ncbi:MAG: MMPL family transporter [Acidimicrobiia bacterium]
MVHGGVRPESAGGATERLSLLGRLGRGAARRKWWVLAAWVVAVVAIGIGSTVAGGRLRDTFTIPGTDSQKAIDVLDSRFPSQNLPTAQVVLISRSGALPETLSAGTATAVEKLPDVESVSKPRVSTDGATALLTVTYSVPYQDIPKDAFVELQAATKSANSADVRVEYGGTVVDLLDQQSSMSDHSDEIGLAVALVIMVISFGSVIAAMLPLVIAILGVGAATGLLDLFAGVFTIGTIAPILGAMIGLGVGIDYSLFIVTRFRQNRADGLEIGPAVSRAIATAGSAVLFAGVTVCIALLGLTLAGVPYVSMLGVSASLFVGVMVIAALTLLPAALASAGKHIKPKDTAGGRFWRDWAREIAKRPWVCLVASLVVLLVLAAPAIRMELGFADDGDDPKSLTQRQAYDGIAKGFGAGANGPLLITVSLPKPTAANEQADLTAVEALVARIEKEPGVTEVTGPIPSPEFDAAVAIVQPKGAPNAESTRALVRDLRDRVIPDATAGTTIAGAVYVGGQTAELIDLTARINSRLLLCIGFVVLGAFILLLVVFRSILVPLKAAVMNLLSIGAAYGVIVMVFQWGWGRGLLGLEQAVPIEAFVPLIMFAILFGLSMDYEVFLLSRIREEFLRTGDNRESVATGVASTARVISSAALIMISVFLSFVVSDQPVVKMLGLGLAVAIAVDATIVRLVLVPATMELLGPANWWFPKWLDRIVPHLDVDAPVTPPGSDPEAFVEPDPVPVSAHR